MHEFTQGTRDTLEEIDNHEFFPGGVAYKYSVSVSGGV